MSVSDLNLAINIAAVDLASSTLKSIGSSLKSLSSGEVKDAAKNAAGILTGIGAAAIGVAAQSVSMAADYQQSMLKVQSLAGYTKQQIDQANQAILDMAGQVGQSPKLLADALYYVASAGFSGSSALQILRLSAESAATGGTDTMTVANGLTSALNAFGISGDKASTVMDMITKTVSAGKMQMSEYANTIGKLSTVSKASGVSFAEANAALATMTNSGYSAQYGATLLSNLFTSLDIKTDALAKHAKSLGISFDEQKFKSLSLADQIKYLDKATGGSTDTMYKLLGSNSTALKTYEALKTNLSSYNQTLNTVKNSQGATATAFATAQQGFNQQMAQAKAAVDALMIRVGTALLPVLSRLIADIIPVINHVSDWAEKNHVVEKAIAAVKTAIGDAVIAIQNIIGFIQNAIVVVQHIAQFFVQWHEPIMNVAGALLLFFAPALITAGVQATIAGAKIAAQFVASLVTTGIKAVVSAAQVTGSFIASMITAGTQAWIQGARIVSGFVSSLIAAGTQAIVADAKIVANFVASMITAGAQAVLAGAKIAAQFVASVVLAGVSAVTTAAQFIGSLIPAIISFAAEALIAAATAIPAILAGFGAWVVGAVAVAAANIAAFWPIYLVIAAIIAIIAVVIIAIKNWGAIAGWLQAVWKAVGAFFVGLWHDIQSIWSGAVAFFTAIGNGIGAAFRGVGDFLAGIWTGIQNGFKNAINWVIGGLNSFITFLDGLQISIPKIDAGPIHFGGATIGLPYIPTIPLLARGGTLTSGGSVVVGDAGPEILDLPAGATVTPLRNAASSGTITINITVNAPARSRNEAQEIADMVHDRLSRKLRGSGNITTWTSGGRS